MSRTTLLAAAAALAVIAGGASAAPEIGAYSAKISPDFHRTKGAQMLYNQNSNASGAAIGSQNFTSGTNTAYNDSGADDFVVPKGETWTVTEVDVTGTYINNSVPAASENVIFYKNNKKMPGKAVRGGTFTDLNCSGSPSFSCSLGKGIKLNAGHYWMAVVANCSESGGCGQWFWGLNNTIHFKQAVWENPNGGFGVCPTWGTLTNCSPLAPYGADLMFDLQGKSKQE